MPAALAGSALPASGTPFFPACHAHVKPALSEKQVRGALGEEPLRAPSLAWPACALTPLALREGRGGCVPAGIHGQGICGVCGPGGANARPLGASSVQRGSAFPFLVSTWGCGDGPVGTWAVRTVSVVLISFMLPQPKYRTGTRWRTEFTLSLQSRLWGGSPRPTGSTALGPRCAEHRGGGKLLRSRQGGRERGEGVAGQMHPARARTGDPSSATPQSPP